VIEPGESVDEAHFAVGLATAAAQAGRGAGAGTVHA
jgi:hypothetical protein